MGKYFKATVKAGHVGRNNHIEINLFIIAETKKEAAQKARWTPRVKHHDKGAIVDIVEITQEEFDAGKTENSMNPYFRAKNIQEQRTLCGQLGVKQNITGDDYKHHIKHGSIKEFRKTDPRKFQKYYGTHSNGLYYKNEHEVA